MKHGFYFLLGLVGALGLSWAGIVMGSNTQLASLPPYADDTDTSPPWFPGEAARGEYVYKDLGCSACHTQQVRRPDFGSDVARGWGDRQSVARDYIYQPFPQLGNNRVGPDLTNLAGRRPNPPDEEDLMKLLYEGHGGMPAYKFLFEQRKIIGQVSDHAIKPSGAAPIPAGYELVPSRRAQMLVAYLRNLNTTSDYPESRPIPAAGAESAGSAPKAKPAPAKAASGAAPAPAKKATP